MKCHSLEACLRYLAVVLGGNSKLVYYEAFEGGGVFQLSYIPKN